MENLRDEIRNHLTEIRKIKDKMKYGEYILYMARNRDESSLYCDILFEELVKEDLKFYRNILCLHFYTRRAINKSNKYYKEMMEIAQNEVEMFKQEIAIAEKNVAKVYNSIVTNKKKNELLQRVKENKNLYLDEEIRRKYDKITTPFYEAKVEVNKKLIGLTMCCMARTECQQYEAGLISKKEYNKAVSDIYPFVDKIAKKFGVSQKTIKINYEQCV